MVSPGLASGLALSCLFLRPLQKMVESQRQNVLGEFERLRRLLAEEEQQLLQKLEEEELEVLPRLREGATRLGQQSAQLGALISELENRCQLPALGLLQVSGPGGASWGGPRYSPGDIRCAPLTPRLSTLLPSPDTQGLHLPIAGLPQGMKYSPRSQPLACLLHPPLDHTQAMLLPMCQTMLWGGGGEAGSGEGAPGKGFRIRKCWQSLSITDSSLQRAWPAHLSCKYHSS